MRLGSFRKKGVYVVSERACLFPNSGAGKHIEIGLEELAKYFDIELTLFCKPLANTELESFSRKTSESSHNKDDLLKRAAGRLIKWWWLLVKNHISFIRYYRHIKSMKPDFIYERASFLNFNGILISRLLKIPHFYEVNGLYYKDNSHLFIRPYTALSKRLERWAYGSTRCFFVGGLNFELGIDEGPMVHVVQNGIEHELVDFYEKLPVRNLKENENLNIIFVGHAMKHHRLDILIDALKSADQRQNMNLHFVGSNYEKHLSIYDTTGLNVQYHGVLDHSRLKELLQSMHVGVVPFALDYYSNMKVFLYGAAKLGVVIPSVRNFRHVFQQDEVFFFENGNIAQLSGIFDSIVSSTCDLNQKNQKLFLKVSKHYTWRSIFNGVAKVIEQ